MRRIALFGAVLVCALMAAPAQASYEPENLAEVASVFAQQPVTVLCATQAEDPWLGFAWGYVDLMVPVIHMDAYLCDAIVDVNDPAFGLKRKALGALVLTHEALHLRKSWAGRASEAETECKASRHVRYAAQFLGASYELAMRLRDLAVQWHDKLARDFPPYDLPGCVVPRA
jgi:hypothetical protein